MKALVKKPFAWILRHSFKKPDFELNERTAEFSFLFSALSLDPGLKVLDVGAGTSSLPHLLSYCGYKVEAVDLNPNNYFFDVKSKDISKSPYRENRYDFVTCISVLEHIPDYDSAVKNMIAGLKQGGILILTTPFSQSGYVDNYLLDSDPKTKKLCHKFSRDNIEKWVKDNNLEKADEKFFRSGLYTPPSYKPEKPIESNEDEADLVCLALRKR